MNNTYSDKNATALNSKLGEEGSTTNFVDFESNEQNLHFEGVLDIDPRELKKRLKDVMLIDVRQPEEFTGELGHIPGSQLFVLDNLEDNLDSIPRDRTIVTVCRSGSRSAKAIQLLNENGFKSLYNLKGGMLLWNDLHLPTEI